MKLCPSCNTKLRPIESWVSICPTCGLYLSSLEPGPGQAFEGLESLRRQNFETVLNAIERIRPLKGLRLLEIGSAKGWFLEAARERGAIVTGVEPVAGDAAVAQRSGLHVEEGLFPNAPSDKGPYDVIAFNDVFEHIPDPAAALGEIDKCLAADGILSINIPSSSGPVFKIAKAMAKLGIYGPYDRMWQRGLSSPHMAYFSPDNLKLLIQTRSSLRLVNALDLPAISTEGLKDRLQSRSVGIPLWILYPSIVALSSLFRFFPSDIHLALFSRRN